MMIETFNHIKRIIEEGASLLVPAEISEACHQRLLTALQEEITPLEIAILIRHFLRREDEKIQGGTPQTLKVPRHYPYPQDRKIWEQSGIKIIRETSDYFLIFADPWTPKWLNFSQSPEKDAFGEVPRRNYQRIPGDPFLSLVGLTHYRSIGQREVIRAILSAPPNSTLVVNLPTGAGKSLCFHLLALLKSAQGVTIVIVPTISLALDQERSIKAYISHPTAYYRDDSEVGQARRKEIRQRIRQGTQRIVFTSPEGLLTSLSPCLYDAASRGYLRYFVIDEVHIVEQWGEEFRPAFQEIPSLRRDLLKHTSFKTILLTATLTESCLNTLKHLFADPREFKVISAVQLRPELSYWFVKCTHKEERNSRLLEAVCHLPRPLIIYASKREDVYQWSDILSQYGFKRFAMMTGESDTGERSQLIEKWREKKIDLVIATSAFGLGVDLQDVRSVIHLCIPETIDRFYQEVGRVGRDGKAAISLTLYTKDDYKIAESLNKTSSITLELGLKRWESMFHAKETLPDGSYRLPLGVPPSMSEKDIDMNSEKHLKWNRLTLNLMSQAKLIDLEWEQPQQNVNQNSRLVRIKNQFHLSMQTWEDYVEPIRQHREQRNTENLDLMKETLLEYPSRCISEIFSQAYTQPGIRVSSACGGCPWCRQHKRSSFAQIMPQPLPIWQNSAFSLGLELKRILKGAELLLIFYNTISEELLDRLLRWFISQGVINLISPVPLDLPQEATIFTHDHYQPITLYRVPTFIYCPPSYQVGNFLSGSISPRIVLLPSNTPDPTRSDRYLIDIFNGRSFKIEVFCQEINL